MTDPVRDAGSTARRLEPLHALGYFAAEVQAELTGAGLRAGHMAYVASRAAAMGAVGPGPVAATFYVFDPRLVAQVLPAAWQAAAPSEVVAARYRGVDAAWRRLLGDDVLGSAPMREAAGLARTATDGCDVAGRPLFAAHADQPWPDEPHLVLFHALTLLREHRGDGHVAALGGAGLDGLEALVSHTATGRGFTVRAARTTRGWSQPAWQRGVERLQRRGLLDDEDSLTPDGRVLRADVERQTEQLAYPPWRHLGGVGTQRLRELAVPLAEAAVRAGAFPAGVFA